MLYDNIPTRMMRKNKDFFSKFGMIQGEYINTEFSLQRASQNSRENNQRQSWSQIRKLWAMFIICCCWICYDFFASFHSLFYPFLAA